jgi:hypothetical protein
LSFANRRDRQAKRLRFLVQRAVKDNFAAFHNRVFGIRL